MRVIDHKRRKSQDPKKRFGKKPVILVLGLLLVGGGLVAVINRDSADNQQQQNAQVATNPTNQNVETTAKTGALKMFTGVQFKDLYNSFAYPNTKMISQDTAITGNEQADARIRQVAIKRGYMVRSAPVSDTFQDVGEGYLLQQRAAKPWLDLQAAAKKDGINIGLTAAYRSAEDQKLLFLQQINRIGLTPEAIALGTSDAQVSQILRSTAIPAFSRHHNGYTIDISCDDSPVTAFEYTACFEWLSANNYEKSKTYGWIPSYPEGAGDQGPDPESWEYVWVGTDAVRQ